MIRPRRVAAYPSTAWSPSDISASYDDPSLRGWWKADAGCFDATAGGSACVDGSVVNRWEDQSGNGYHLTTTTGAATDNRPYWSRPADQSELPAIRWNVGATAGVISNLRWTQTGLGWLGRLNCPIVDGRSGIFVAAAVRCFTDGNAQQGLNPVALIHGAPENGSDYDKLRWFAMDLANRTGEVVGGVQTYAQRRWYCWQKFTPEDDAVPSPYSYTMSPNSFGAADSDNASGTGRFGRSRRWMVVSYGTSRAVPNVWSASRWTWQVCDMGRVVSTSDWGGTSPTTSGTFPSTTSNALLVNGYGVWSDYGFTSTSSSMIGEIIILGGIPSHWLRWKIEGYLAHRWGCASGLMHDLVVGSVSNTAATEVPTSYHPYRRAVPPKFANWRPTMISTLRGWFDETTFESQADGQELDTWRDNGFDQRHLVNGNWLQDFHVSATRRNGRRVTAWRLGSSTISSREMATGATGELPLATHRTLRGQNGFVAVFVLRCDTTADRIFCEWRTVSTTADHFAFRTLGGKFCVSRWLNLTTGDTQGTTTFTTSDWRIVMASMDYAGGVRQLWVNGTKEAETTGLATGTSPNVANIRVGADFNNTSSSFVGNIAEVVFFSSTLSTSDRQSLEGYLSHKWSIALPAGHPYEEQIP